MLLPKEMKEKMDSIKLRMEANAAEGRALVEEAMAFKAEMMAHVRQNSPDEYAVLKKIEDVLFGAEPGYEKQNLA